MHTLFLPAPADTPLRHSSLKNVCFWHLADIPVTLINVHFRG